MCGEPVEGRKHALSTRALGLVRLGEHEAAAAVAAPLGSDSLLAQVACGPVVRTALDPLAAAVAGR
jgi:hypothetical protein